MFLTHTKALLVEAMEAVYGPDFPEADFRDLEVTMDFPNTEVQYPGCWVDFSPATAMQNVGIGHVEYTAPDINGQVRACSRWRFTGWATFTFVALTTMERDRMVDSFLYVVAFGLENPDTSIFRRMIESNSLIGMTFNWDRVTLTGRAESEGTPWGSDEWVYEQTVQLEVANGEFVSEGTTNSLIPLSQVIVSDPTALPPQPVDDLPGFLG